MESYSSSEYDTDMEASDTSPTIVDTASHKDKMSTRKKIAKELEREKKKQRQKERNTITKHDFYNKNHEFRLWLQETKDLEANALSKAQSKSYFKVFVKKWNSVKLDKKYYRGVDIFDIGMTSVHGNKNSTKNLSSFTETNQETGTSNNPAYLWKSPPNDLDLTGDTTLMFHLRNQASNTNTPGSPYLSFGRSTLRSTPRTPVNVSIPSIPRSSIEQDLPVSDVNCIQSEVEASEKPVPVTPSMLLRQTSELPLPPPPILHDEKILSHDDDDDIPLPPPPVDLCDPLSPSRKMKKVPSIDFPKPLIMLSPEKENQCSIIEVKEVSPRTKRHHSTMLDGAKDEDSPTAKTPRSPRSPNTSTCIPDVVVPAMPDYNMSVSVNHDAIDMQIKVTPQQRSLSKPPIAVKPDFKGSSFFSKTAMSTDTPEPFSLSEATSITDTVCSPTCTTPGVASIHRSKSKKTSVKPRPVSVPDVILRRSYNTSIAENSTDIVFDAPEVVKPVFDTPAVVKPVFDTHTVVKPVFDTPKVMKPVVCTPEVVKTFNEKHDQSSDILPSPTCRSAQSTTEVKVVNNEEKTSTTKKYIRKGLGRISKYLPSIKLNQSTGKDSEHQDIKREDTPKSDPIEEKVLASQNVTRVSGTQDIHKVDVSGLLNRPNYISEDVSTDQATSLNDRWIGDDTFNNIPSMEAVHHALSTPGGHIIMTDINFEEPDVKVLEMIMPTSPVQVDSPRFTHFDPVTLTEVTYSKDSPRLTTPVTTVRQQAASVDLGSPQPGSLFKAPSVDSGLGGKIYSRKHRPLSAIDGNTKTCATPNNMPSNVKAYSVDAVNMTSQSHSAKCTPSIDSGMGGSRESLNLESAKSRTLDMIARERCRQSELLAMTKSPRKHVLTSERDPLKGSPRKLTLGTGSLKVTDV